MKPNRDNLVIATITKEEANQLAIEILVTHSGLNNKSADKLNAKTELRNNI